MKRVSLVSKGIEEEKMISNFKLLIEASSEAIIIHKDMKIIEANPAAVKLLGVTDPKELIGRSVVNFIHPDSKKDFEERRNKLLESGEMGITEQVNIRADGSVIYTESRSVVIDHHGEPAVMIIAKDTTEKHCIEEQLTESQELYQGLMEEAGTGIGIWSEDGVLIRFNEIASERMGGRSEDFEGKTFQEIYGESNGKEYHDRIRKTIKSRKSLRFEDHIEFPEGERDYTSYFNAIRNKDGKVVAVQIISHDISDRVKLERDITRNEEKYRTIYENMVQGVFYQSKDGRLLDCNERTLEIFGLTKDQFTGRTSMDPRWKVIDIDGNEISGEKHPSMIAISTGKPQLGKELGVFNPIKEVIVWININAIPQFRNGEKSPYQVFVTIEDISEKKDVQNALIDSEGRFRNIVEHSTNLFYIHGVDQVITYLSPQSKGILGYEPEEAMINWTEMATDNPINEIGLEKTMKAIRSGEAQPPYELELRRKDERIIWVEVREAPLVKDGKTIGIVGSLNDITERKRLITEIQDSKDFLEDLFRTANTIIVTLGPDGKILSFNSYAEKITGYRGEEVIGKNWMNLFIPEEERSAIKEVFYDVLTGKDLHDNQENPIITKEGDLKYISWANTVHLDQRGNVEVILSIGTDVTDKRKSQRELLRSQILLFETLNNLTDSVNVVNQDLELEFVNNSFRVLLKKAGIDEDPLNKNLMTLQPYLPEKVRDEYQRVLKKKEIIQTQEDITIGDIEFVTETIKIPLIINDRIEKIITVIRDITKEKESERRILEERGRSEFYLDLLGHDIGNLHQGIYTGLQLARRASDPEVKEMGLDSTEELIKRSVKLVKNVLLLSRIGAKEPELERLDLRNIIRSSIEHVRLMFPGKKIEIEEGLGKGKLEIMAEPIVEELFLNLMHNGIKFQEGKVPKLEIDIKKNKDDVTVIISDHGFGIKDPEKERLFGRFAPHGKGSQTGIGLSLVKALADRYRGEIMVRNRVDGDYRKGTKFLVKFPLV